MINYRLLSGLLGVIIGCVLLGYGFYGKYRMNEAREDIESTTGFIPENPVKGFVTEKLHGEVDQYALPVALCFVGGVVFIIIGGVILHRNRDQKFFS